MKCKNCGNELVFLPSYTHTDYDTEEEVTHDIYKCNICNFIEYVDDKDTVVEFTFNFKETEVRMLLSDQEVSINKMKEKEYAE